MTKHHYVIENSIEHESEAVKNHDRPDIPHTLVGCAEGKESREHKSGNKVGQQVASSNAVDFSRNIELCQQGHT